MGQRAWTFRTNQERMSRTARDEGQSIDDLQNRAIARLHEDVVDVDDEAQRLLSLIKYAREAVTKSMTSGMGHKQEGVSRHDMESLKDLSAMFEKVSRSIGALDRTAELRSKKLTRTQYLDVAYKLVISLPWAERGRWLKRAVEQHNALCATLQRQSGVKQLQEAVPDIVVPEPPPAQEPCAELGEPGEASVE